MDIEKRKKMSLEVIPATIIDFRGLERGEMMTRDDDDIVTDFTKFCFENKNTNSCLWWACRWRTLFICSYA